MSLRETSKSSLYKNGALNWVYLAKNMSFFMIHPEQLKQKLKEKDAHMLCQFFDSEEYKRRITAFLEKQSKILSKETVVGTKRAKYKHVLSCAQPEHKRQKDLANYPTKINAVNDSKPKKAKKGTIMDQLINRKTHMEAIKQAESRVKNEGPRRKIRHRTTIMPIFLKKMRTKHKDVTDTEENNFNAPGYHSQTARRVPEAEGEPEPLYAQILHRSNMYKRGLKTLACDKEHEASLKGVHSNEDRHTVTFGNDYGNSALNLDPISDDGTHTLIFEGDAEKPGALNNLMLKSNSYEKLDAYLEPSYLETGPRSITFDRAPDNTHRKSRYSEENPETFPTESNSYQRSRVKLESHNSEKDPETFTVESKKCKSPIVNLEYRYSEEDPESLTLENVYYKKPSSNVESRDSVAVENNYYKKPSFNLESRDPVTVENMESNRWKEDPQVVEGKENSETDRWAGSHNSTFESNFYKERKLESDQLNKSGHTLTFGNKPYKPLNLQTNVEPSRSVKIPHNYAFENESATQRHLNEVDNSPIKSTHSSSTPRETYSDVDRDTYSQAEEVKGDSQALENITYNVSSSKLVHMPYRLSTMNSKYAEDSRKLGNPSNVRRVPLRMSSSAARMSQRSVTTKLCPRQHFTVKRKNYSELLSVVPMDVRIAKAKKANKPNKPETEMEIEILSNAQVQNRPGKGTGDKGEINLQMLMEKISKNRSLDMENTLERSNTLKTFLRNKIVHVKKKKNHLELASLFQKVKMGSISKNKPNHVVVPQTDREIKPKYLEPKTTSKPLLVDTPKTKKVRSGQDSCTYKVVTKNRERMDQRLKKKFRLNSPFWRKTFSAHLEKSVAKPDKTGKLMTVEQESAEKFNDFLNLEETNQKMKLISKNLPTNMHRPVPHFVKHADKTNTSRPSGKIVYYSTSNNDSSYSRGSEYLLRLPKTTVEGYRVLMYSVRDPDPTKMNFNDVVKGFCMYNDCVLSEDGLQDGYIVIFDMKDVGIGHLARVSLPALKCFMYYIQDAHPCRLKQIHVLNTSSWIHHIMRLVVPLVRSELLSLLRFHKGSIPDNFPVELLPMDYGGEAPRVEDLDLTTKSLLNKYHDWLIETSEFKADESKRIKKASWWGLFSVKSPQQNELDEKAILRNLQID